MEKLNLEFIASLRFTPKGRLDDVIDSVLRFFVCYHGDFYLRRIELARATEDKEPRFFIIATNKDFNLMIRLNDFGEIEVTVRGQEPDRMQELLSLLYDYLMGNKDARHKGKD